MKYLGAVSVIALISGLSGVSLAQEGDEADNGAYADDIVVVTARKREESLLEVPVSVSAFSADRIQSAGITSAAELGKFVPGLDFQQWGSGTDGGATNPNITFRGIRQQLSGPSNQVGAIFWDGSYMGAGAGIVPLDDLERVEVIKGPQTAYFGRNTFAGAINYIPASPGEEFGGRGELSYSPSQDDSYKAAISVGGPITDNTGVRVSLLHNKRGADYYFGDGEPLDRSVTNAVSAVFWSEPVENLTIKASGYLVDVEDTYVNVSIDATTEAGECDAVFSGNYINTTTGELTPFTRDFSTLSFATFCGAFPGGNDDLIVAPQSRFPTAANTVGGNTDAAFFGNALLAPFDFLPGMPGSFGGHHKAGRGQFNIGYEFGDGHSFDLIASRAVFGSSYAFDNFFGLNASGLMLTRGEQTWIRETYLEARVTSPQDQSFRYMVGGTLYDQQYRNGRTGTVDSINFEDSDSLSAFIALDYDLTDQITISAEGRYTDDSTSVIFNGDPDLAGDPLAVTEDEENSFSKFIPRAILTYKPLDGTTLYASWSRSALIGEQTNVSSVFALDPSLIPDPEAVGTFTPAQQNTSYELGWKQEFDRLSFSLAAFLMDWENQVFRTTVLAGTQTTAFALPGQSEYKGIELEMFARPTDWLDLQGGMIFVDSELKSYAARSSFEFFVLGSGTLSVVADGFRPRGVAKWHGNFSATVHGPIAGKEGYLRTDVLYTGGQFADNLEFNKVDGAAKINLRGGMELNDNTIVEVYVKNLTDNRQLPTIAFTTFGLGPDRKIFTPAPPKREFGARLLVDF